MDTLGIEPRPSRMLSGCDTTTPCALELTTVKKRCRKKRTGGTCRYNKKMYVCVCPGNESITQVWSSGYDVSLTRRRSPVRSRVPVFTQIRLAKKGTALHTTSSILAHGPHRLVVRTSRRGRDNPGSTPGAVSIEIPNSGQPSHYSLDNGRLKTRNLKPINRLRGKPFRRWLSRNFEIRGSIVVSISACHADDPGSIPGRGDSYALNAWATCLLRSQCTNMEALQMAPGDNLRLQWHGGTLLPTTWQPAAKF